MEKIWQVSARAPEEFLRKFPERHPLILQLLYNRGITAQDRIEDFFHPDYARLHDPFLFKDMEKAVDRLATAIFNREKIIIHGDYDADGVSGSAILYRALRMLGAVVEVFIPHREEDGYGINERNVARFKADGAKILLTTDCGTSNVAEAEALHAAGIELIITDHHQIPPVLPRAFALMNPHAEDSGYPFAGLTGAGVAFKLVQALFSRPDLLNPRARFLEAYGGGEGFKKWLLDLAAIGTVADIGPLVGENRVLVKWGLVVLNQTRNIGLERLLKIINPKTVDAHTIGFQLAPRINAAGRLEHARQAFDLLVEDEGERAEKMAWEIHQCNLRRQKITEKMLGDADKESSNPDHNFLFFYDRAWEPGVVGLVAGRLADRFYRPVLAMTRVGDKVVGSGRSVPGFNITEALRSVSRYLERFGGHEQACGFTLKDESVLPELRASLMAEAAKALTPEKLSPKLSLDAEVALADLSEELILQLEQFAPFGEGNPRPKFLLRDLLAVAVEKIGAEGKHLKILTKQASPKIFKMIWFYPQPEMFTRLQRGVIMDAVVELGLNVWNGRSEPEIKIVELKIKS